MFRSVSPWESSREESQRVATKTSQGFWAQRLQSTSPASAAANGHGHSPRAKPPSLGQRVPGRYLRLLSFAWVTQPQTPSETSLTNKQAPSLPIPTLSRCFLGPFAFPAKLWQPQQFLRRAETAGAEGPCSDPTSLLMHPSGKLGPQPATFSLCVRPCLPRPCIH